MGISISHKSTSPLDRLVQMIAAQKNPHELISQVAAETALIKEVTRLCQNLRESEWPSRQEYQDLCHHHRVTPEYFEEKLWLIAYFLHLVEHQHNYYEILGVSRTASQREIKQAFRRLSLSSHPDVNPNDSGALQRFRELHHAYQVLSDQRLRRHYDQQTALPDWPNEMSPEDRSPSSRVRRWRWRYIVQLATVVGLLVAVSLLVDYQEWAANRYYRTKVNRTHEMTSSVAVPEPDAGNGSGKASELSPATVPADREVLTASPALPIAPDPNAVHRATVVSDAGSRAVHGHEVQEAVAKNPESALTPIQTKRIDQLAVPDVRSDRESSSAPPAQPQKPRESKGKADQVRSSGDSVISKKTSRQEQERTVAVAQRGPLSGEPPAKPAKNANPDSAPVQKVVPVQHLHEHIRDFLNRYTRTYESKDVGALMRFFETDALENGKPIAALIHLYQGNFERAEMIQYQILMSRYTTSENQVEISGAFRLKSQLIGQPVRESAGSIQLTLLHRGNAYRIRRLDYQFATPGESTSLRN